MNDLPAVQVPAQLEERKPWDQLPDEDPVWYDRFRAWLQRHKPRSLLAFYNDTLAEKGGKKPSVLSVPHAWDAAKEKYRWAERTAAYDAAYRSYLDVQLAAQREKERQSELSLAVLLREKAIALLALPHLQERIKRNKEGEVIDYLLVPDHKAFQTAANMLAEAMNHARSALEMSDKRIDLRKLKDDELIHLITLLVTDREASPAE